MRWFPSLLKRNRAAEQDVADWSDLPVAAPDTPFTTPTGGRATKNGAAAPSAKIGFSVPESRLLRRAGDRFGAERTYRHAFTPSQPVADIQRLAGRTDLIRAIIRSLEDMNMHVVLYGDRGIGKTSLLKVVEGLARQAGYIVHNVSCDPSATFSEVFRSLAQRISLLFDGSIDPTLGSDAVAGNLAERLPAGDYSVSQLSEVLGQIEGARVLLVLDEFDRSDVEHFRRQVGQLVKNLSDRSVRLQLLIGGVANNVTELVTHIPSIRRNIIGIGVPNLNEAEIAEMIAIGEASGQVRFDDAARRELADVSAGLPYLVGLIGQHAILAASDRGEAQIGKAHVVDAVKIARAEIASRLSLRSNHCIERIAGTEAGATIELAAHAALREGGIVIDEGICARLEKDKALLADVVEPIADDPRKAWRFIEDGVASLVWLRAIRAN